MSAFSQEGLLGGMDVAAHHALGPGAVVRRQRVDQLAVVAEAARELLGRVAAEGLLHDGHLDRARQHGHQPLVAARLGEDAVELAVQAPDARGVLGAGVGPVRLDLVLQPPQLGQLVRRDACRGIAGDLALDEDAQLEDLRHLLRRPLAHHRPAVRLEAREAVGHQQPHGLAHGRAGGVELRGDALLGDPRAGPVPAVDDLFLDRAVDARGDRFHAQRAQCFSSSAPKPVTRSWMPDARSACQ
jgi:hypothetical protein